MALTSNFLDSLSIFMADDSSPVIWRFKRPKVPVQLPAPKSRRQRFLSNILFEHQAVEAGANDESVTGSDNSDDDNDEADLSCITDVSVSVDDDDLDMYRRSLTSQASEMGFGTPLARKRRGSFKSSYDKTRGLTPTWGFAGTVCPQNHMCKIHLYRTSHHGCDLCSLDILEGTKGVFSMICHSHIIPRHQYDTFAQVNAVLPATMIYAVCAPRP
jgi:hypothetical protein